MQTGPVLAPTDEVPVVVTLRTGDVYMKRLLNGPGSADAAPGPGSEPEESR